MVDKDKAEMKRPLLYADDLDRLVDLMASRGVTGNPADVFHGLLTAFERELGQQQQRQVQTVGEVAQTLNWFTREIESLRGQIVRLEQKQQPRQEQSVDLKEVAQLRAENADLRAELEQTQSRLTRIQELLGVGEPDDRPQNGHPARPVETVPTQTAEVAPPPPGIPSVAPQTPASKSPAPADVSPDPRIDDVIDAIIKWNTAQNRNDMRLRISFSSLRSLAVLVGASYQQAIREVMTQRKKAIDEMHQRYLLGSRHNRSVHDKDAVIKAIARDYMGVSNWNEGEYIN